MSSQRSVCRATACGDEAGIEEGDDGDGGGDGDGVMVMVMVMVMVTVV